MESSEYTWNESYADVNSLHFGNDPLQVKKYIQKRLDKNDAKYLFSCKDLTFRQHYMQNCKSVNPLQHP